MNIKQSALLLLVSTLFVINASAQSLRKDINRDSLLNALTKDLPDEARQDLQKQYKEGNAQTQEFLIFMLTMPRSSKAELVKNIDQNYEKIGLLKKEYAKLVPKGYKVYIEFDPGNKYFSVPETITLKIRHGDDYGTIDQNWQMAYGSEKLKTMLAKLHWTEATLKTIKKLLADAHCISIENESPVTIGFSRSGMGMYFYKLLDHKLTPKEATGDYNNGCTYIFYKNNIVLEYGGGATGPQCFPDKD